MDLALAVLELDNLAFVVAEQELGVTLVRLWEQTPRFKSSSRSSAGRG